VITVETVLPRRYEVLTEMVTNIIIVFVGVPFGWSDMSKFLLYYTESHFRDYNYSKKRLHEERNCVREGNFTIVLRKTFGEKEYCIDLVRIVFSCAVLC
jgi:hypothetical protein